MSVLLLCGLTTYGRADFESHIQENSGHRFKLPRHSFINGMQDKISHRNDTADVRLQDNDTAADTEELPTFTVSRVITECLPQMSFSCVQKKFLLFLKSLGAMENVILVGDSVSIVRTSRVNSLLTEDSGLRERMNTIKDQEGVLGYLVDQSAEIYLDTHAIRIKLPSWIRAEVGGSGETTDLDFGLENSATEEGKRLIENSQEDEYGVASQIQLSNMKLCRRAN